MNLLGDTNARFDTTRWSVVAAAKGASGTDGEKALATLCEAYWPPIYAFARRRGAGASEAEDLTQAFFAQLLETESVRYADQERGKFRTFLLAAFNNFATHQRSKAHAQKRGGGAVTFSIDAGISEEQYASLGAETATPEAVFDRQWALSVLQKAIDRLHAEFEQAGKLDTFVHLRIFLMGDGEARSYAEVAQNLATSEGSVRVAVHRLRRRFRTILCEEIADTVPGPDEVEEELRYLFQALGDTFG